MRFLLPADNSFVRSVIVESKKIKRFLSGLKFLFLLFVLFSADSSFGQITNNYIDYANGLHGTVCVTQPESNPGPSPYAVFNAPAGTVFTTVSFSSYGTPGGSCYSFTINPSCNATTSQSVVEGYLLGNNSANIPPSNSAFTDPCVGTYKALYVQAVYTQPICSGTSPGIISGTVPAGGTAPYTYSWEQSTTSSSTGFTAIAGATGQNYTPGTLNQTTWFRRKVTGGPSSGYSAILQVTVSPLSVGGSVGTSSTVCSGTNSGTLSLTGQTGSVIRWESSINGGTSWTTVANTTTSQSYTNLIQTTQYRAVVQSGACSSANSSVATITVNAVSAGGAVGTNATVCSGSNSGTAILTGQTGSVVRWEISTDGGTTWSAVANTTTSQAYSNLTQTTMGRAVVQNGVCASANSSAATITVNAVSVGGTVSTNATVCSGTNSGTLNLTGQTGNVIRWESSLDGGTTWTTIANTTTSQSYSNLTQTTQYRAVVQSGVCSSANSSAATITVSPAPSATISYSGSPFCINSGTASVTSTGTTGGTYSSTAGLSINSATGAINLNSSTAGTYTVTYTIAASGGCAIYTTTASVTINTIPAAPTVTTPINYCLNAVASQLTATGSNLTWGSGSISGTAGGTITLSTLTYIDGTFSNKKTNFTTTASNVKITSVDYYIPAWQSVSNLVLALYNSSGTVIATSSTNTTLTNGGSAVTITNIFNYTIASAGNYSIGISTGTGTIGGDSPSFPITEATGTINVTGTTNPGSAPYHCFNKIQFSVNNGSIAPTPSTSVAGTTNYLVSQTVSGCVSPQATIAVIVNNPPSATISYSATPYCQSVGTAQPVTQSGTSGGTYSALPSGLSINSSTGAITPSSSTAGIYTVTYTMAAAGGCSAQTTTTSVTITAIPSATISYGGTPYCKSVATAQPVTQSGTTGGTYSVSPSGLSINASTGAITPSASTAGTYTVTYTMSASGCSTQTATTLVTITALPSAAISYGGSPFCQSVGTAQSVTFTGTGGGSFSASPSGLTINSSTGAITPSTSTPGTYTVTYTIAASGGCSIYTTTTSITINATPAAPTVTTPINYCLNVVASQLTATGSNLTWGSGGGSVSGSVGGTSTLSAVTYIDNTYNNKKTNFTTAVPNVTITNIDYYIPSYQAVSGMVLAIYNSSGTVIATSSTTTTQTAGSSTVKISNTFSYTISTAGNYSVGVYAGSGNIGSDNPSFPITESTGTINITGVSVSGYRCFNNIQFTANNGSIAPTPSTSATGTTNYLVTQTVNGCVSPQATIAVIVNAPPSATISYSGSPFCINSGTASVTSTGTSGGTYSSTAGLSINSATGAINLNSSSAGTYIVTYTIAASGGCSIYTTTTSITVNPSVGIPVFALGSTSARCQGAGSVTYTATATNAGGITYSLDAASISGGNSINSSTGAVTYTAGWNGTSTITASASGCGGPATSIHTVTTGTIPSVSATTTYTCVGGSSGTITASGSGGSTPYTYSLNGGTYQSGNLFTGLAAGTYTLGIKTNTGCTASTSVIVSPYPNSTDDQTAAGANTWIGHMYSGMTFNNYIGHFTEAETFDEGFGGDYNCFTVSSGATYPSIYTEQFSVRFRMNSSRDGLYAADLGSDDGSRLYVDGTLIYNNWVDQSFSTRPSVLMNLTGSSSLVYEFYENAINNRVIFNNFTLILANNLTSNTTQSICTGNTGSVIGGDSFGTLPSGISLSGTGYQWTYSSTPTGTRTNISGATSATYSPNTSIAPFNVPGTYYIYRNAKLSSTNNTGVSPYVATNESNAAIITVISSSVGGTVGSNSTVCSGTNSGTVNLTGQNGNVLKWQYSVDGGTTWTDIANSTTSQSFSNLTQTTLGRAVVQSGVCTSANSSSVTITVSPVSVGGTVNSSATVCSGTNSGTLNLTGNTGSVIRWEYSTNGGTTWTTIANTTTSQTYSNITLTTQYRAVVQSGVCTSANSSSVTITVNPVSVGGTVNSSATVCSGTNSGTLNLTGNTGNVIRWEYSTNGGSTWTTIANTTASQTYSNITQTTQYRAVVQSGVCASANSSSATITVNPVSVGGTINSSATVCSGTNSGTLNLTGNTGSVIRWEYSTNGGTTWTTIANTTTSQTYSNITLTTQYRAVVQSGVCTSANSSSVTITVSPVSVGGTVNSSATVCSGLNSGTLNLTGNTGSVIRWEYSTNGGTTWTTIANTTTSQTYSNITLTTQYRAVVQSGVCTYANSSSVTITVNPVSVGGTVNSSATVCSGTNSGTLNLTGNTGNVIRWEYSTNGGTTWTTIANTTTSQTYSNITLTTQYRAVVQSGVCTSANSTSATITINPVSVGGTAIPTSTVCSGTNSGTLNLTGNNGNVIRWEYSTDGGSTWTIIANTTTSQTYSNITQTTQYSAVVQSGVCASTNSNPGTITVNPAPSAYISYSGSPFCSGGATGTVTQTGTTGGTYSSTSGLAINSITGAIDVSSSAPGNYTVTYSIAAGACAAYSTTTNVLITLPGSWIGTVSADWNDSRNWLCGQIPNSAIDATISAGASYYPNITSGVMSVRNININSGGTLAVAGGTLQIFGSITNSGTFDASNGSIEMHSTSPQTIPVGAFTNNNVKNFIISNTSSGGVTVAGNVDVYQSLTYGAGGTTLNTGGYITLKSNATETAWVGDMTGHTITGDITVERYVAAINNWQFLSVPTQTTQTIHQAWQENQDSGVVGTAGYGTNITGPTGGIGFDFTSPNYSMKYWDWASNSYKTISNTGIQFPNIKNGFFIYIRGDRRATASGATPHQPTVLRTKGPLNTGAVNFTIPANTYYSIGNPYASRVDFSTVSGITGVGSTFYVWDPLIYGSRGAGGYQTFSLAGGYKPLVPTSYYDTSTPDPYLESGQAIFVNNTSASPATMTFTESNKATGSHLAFRVQDVSTSEFFRTCLVTSSGKIADGNAVVFNIKYQNRLDVNDARKISNTGENFGLRLDGVILAIEARAPVTASDTIYFDLRNVSLQPYQFQFNPENMQDEALTAYLLDKYSKTNTEVSLAAPTTVNFTINSDAASYAPDRFMVVFRQASVLPVTFVSIKAVQKDEDVVVSWNVANENNLLQYEVEKSTDGIHFVKVATVAANNNGTVNYQWIDKNASSGYNYYRVVSIDKDKRTLYSTVVNVLIPNLKPTISIYPNPITDGIIHLQLVNQPQGRYSFRLLNPLGQVLVSKQSEFAGGNGSKNIQWNYNLADGVYQLEITRPDGSVTVIRVLY